MTDRPTDQVNNILVLTGTGNHHQKFWLSTLNNDRKNYIFSIALRTDKVNYSVASLLFFHKTCPGLIKILNKSKYFQKFFKENISPWLQRSTFIFQFECKFLFRHSDFQNGGILLFLAWNTPYEFYFLHSSCKMWKIQILIA